MSSEDTMKTLSLLFLFILLCSVPVNPIAAAMPASAEPGQPDLECLFDEGQPTPRLIACGSEALMQRAVKGVIYERYGIAVSDRTARWSLDELRSLLYGLNTMARRFSRVVRHDVTLQFKSLFAGAVFYRDSIAERTIAYTIAGSVSFYDTWAEYDTAGRTFYLAHEMGHLLDTRTALLHLFMGEVSGEFSTEVGAGTVSGVYDLGPDFPRSESERPLRHRNDGPTEDWAESFATVMEPAFEDDIRDIGAARTASVNRHVVRWVTENAESDAWQGHGAIP
jgi:hypothetical protein